MTAEYEKSFAEMVGSEETPYIKAISHAEQFENITVDVDRAAYESALFDVTPLTLGLAGMMYRAFNRGRPESGVVKAMRIRKRSSAPPYIPTPWNSNRAKTAVRQQL
jgi:hypothetical protein